MRRLAMLAILGTLTACWRGSAPVDAAQPSFIAHANALVELDRSADALVPQLEYLMQRLIGLASEAERDAIRTDLARLERDVAQLSRYVGERRAHGDNARMLDVVERKLEQAALAVVQLREELLYAKTTAELAALDELSHERAQADDDRRELFILRMRELVQQSRTEPGQAIDAPPEIRAFRRRFLSVAP
jgi:hypothetical protein